MTDDTLTTLFCAALGLNIAVAITGWLVGKTRPTWARSALLAQVLVSAFFLAIVLTPKAQEDAGLDDSPRLFSLALFLALLGLFKLLGKFEEPH